MHIKSQTVKSDIQLLVAAVIWGLAFVAQRVGMAYVGPFTFTGIRFALGSVCLVPLLLSHRRQNREIQDFLPYARSKMVFLGGLLAGCALFLGVSFQQIGLVHTTAGKAGFITGLYVIIVPILGLLWKQKPKFGTWIGAFMAASGLYLLAFTGKFTLSSGDTLELIGALFWALHVIIIGWLSRRINSFQLAFLQYTTCSILSLLIAFFLETVTISGLLQAVIPIIYGGLFSVGIAYTLQVVAQRHAQPAHAAILLCLESVFAALGGWLILGEVLPLRGFLGCALMLGGMLFSQFQELRSSNVG